MPTFRSQQEWNNRYFCPLSTVLCPLSTVHCHSSNTSLRTGSHRTDDSGRWTKDCSRLRRHVEQAPRAACAAFELLRRLGLAFLLRHLLRLYTVFLVPADALAAQADLPL